MYKTKHEKPSRVAMKSKVKAKSQDKERTTENVSYLSSLGRHKEVVVKIPCVDASTMTNQQRWPSMDLVRRDTTNPPLNHARDAALINCYSIYL